MAVRNTRFGVASRSGQLGGGAHLRLTGFEAIGRSLTAWRGGADALGGMRLVIGSELYYAPFVNARRRFLDAGMAAAMSYLRGAVGPALAGGPGAVRNVLRQASITGLTATQAGTPVRTGRLVSSIRSNLRYVGTRY